MRRTIALAVLLACALIVAGAPHASAGSTLWASTNGLLAFRSNRGGEAGLFTMQATGAGAASLGSSEGFSQLQPAWSPDGARLAFVRAKVPTGRPDLYVMSAGGRGRIRITSTPVPERDPTWSPDGTRIAYAARIGPTGPFRIFVARADGTGRTQLTTQAEGGADRAPAWSPDGTRIAFVSDRDGGFPEIYVMNADGTGLARLTANVFVDGNPSWSPDGTRIAVERCCADGTSEIYAVDVATHAETNLTSSPSSMDFDPSWSPDGTRIAFVAFAVGEGNIDVWVMNADGSAPQRLTDDPSPDLSPDWQPLPVCTIQGTGGSDLGLQGTDLNDVICARGGDDTARGGLGADLIYGGAGNDHLDGEAGSDTLLGEAGDDFLGGGSEYDYLDGGGGTDTCSRGGQGAFERACEL
jgi:Tol biopolymer transport system component